MLSLAPLVLLDSNAETGISQGKDDSNKPQHETLPQTAGEQDGASEAVGARSVQSAAATSNAPLVETHIGDTHVTLVIDDSGDGLVLMVDSPHLNSPGKSFYLKEPSRLVVDLPGDSWEHLSETLPVSQSALIQRVRIGTHPDKLRIVMDLAGDNPLPTSPSIEGRSFRLALNSSESLRADKDTSNTARARLAAIATKEEPSPKSDEQAANIENHTAKTQAPAAQDGSERKRMELAGLVGNTQANTSKSVTSPSEMQMEEARSAAGHLEESSDNTPGIEVEPNRSRIEGLSESELAKLSSKADRRSFETGAQSSLWGITFVSLAPSMTRAIRLDLSIHPEFSLLRKDDTTFTLKIPRVTLKDPSLALPFFPPREFVGLTVVLAREVREGVELTIGVDKGTDLVAAPKEKSLWVKAIKSPSS